MVIQLKGNSAIDIRGSDEYCALYVGGKQYLREWSVEIGTTVEHLIRYHHPLGESQLAEFRKATIEPINEDILIQSIEPFMAPGEYHVGVITAWSQQIELDEIPTNINKPLEYYGAASNNIITTQSKKELNLKTIEWFRQYLKEGNRPLVFGICNNHKYGSGTIFVLDGHHRLEAYNLEKIKPRFFILTRMHPQEIESV